MLLFTTICRPKILTTTILQHSALSRSNARVSRPQQRKLILYTILRDLTMTFDQVLIEGLAVPVGGGGGGGRLSLFLFPIRKLFVGSPLWRGESWRSLVLIKESHFSWLWLIIFPFSQSYKWLEQDVAWLCVSDKRSLYHFFKSKNIYSPSQSVKHQLQNFEEGVHVVQNSLLLFFVLLGIWARVGPWLFLSDQC